MRAISLGLCAAALLLVSSSQAEGPLGLSLSAETIAAAEATRLGAEVRAAVRPAPGRAIVVLRHRPEPVARPAVAPEAQPGSSPGLEVRPGSKLKRNRPAARPVELDKHLLDDASRLAGEKPSSGTGARVDPTAPASTGERLHAQPTPPRGGEPKTRLRKGVGAGTGLGSGEGRGAGTAAPGPGPGPGPGPLGPGFKGGGINGAKTGVGGRRR